MPLILRIVVTIAAVLMIAVVLWDAFETVVLPRVVSHRIRLTRVYFRGTWNAWSVLARRLPSRSRREAILAIYGPLALLVLLALWVFLLIVAYALLLWGLGSPLADPATRAGAAPGFGTDLYFSGTTFLTLGLGDVFPHSGTARGVAVVEVGNGFAVLALVIGYLPILYQAFSRREQRISLLDAHAGSPPSVGALLVRHPPNRRARRLMGILADWEGWSAELLETHLSYPILAYYRSQHEDQSWVAALAVILDACALVLACGSSYTAAGNDARDDELLEQAAFTFAIARHAAVDLAQVFHTYVPSPRLVASGASDGMGAMVDAMNARDGRLPPAEHARLRDLLAAVGIASGAKTGEGGTTDGVEGRMAALGELRSLYEPYIEGLAEFLLMELPPWVPAPGALDDWQTTAEGITAPSIAALVSLRHTAAEQRPISPADRSPESRI